MKKSIWLHSLVVLAGLFLYGPAFGQYEVAYPSEMVMGNDRGNGTEFRDNSTGVAWFAMADRPIRWCYEVADDFGMSSRSVQTEVRAAFKTWSDYLITKKIVPRLPLATTNELVESCSSSVDLKLYFGANPPELKSRDLSRSVAEAIRQKYDPTKGWGQGLIWIAKRGSMDPRNAGMYGVDPGSVYPDWQKSYALRGVLLHELGHAYGIEDHISETIMDQDIFAYIDSDDEELRKGFLTKIDRTKELYICHKCEMRKQGYLGQLPTHSEHEAGQRMSENIAINYYYLTGLPAEPSNMRSYVTSSRLGGYNLVIETESGRKTYPIHLHGEQSIVRFNGSSIFQYFVLNSGSGKLHQATTEYGTLISDTGKHTVAIHRNHASEPFIDFEIQLVAEGGPRTLFISSSYYVERVLRLRVE